MGVGGKLGEDVMVRLLVFRLGSTSKVAAQGFTPFSVRDTGGRREGVSGDKGGFGGVQSRRVTEREKNKVGLFVFGGSQVVWWRGAKGEVGHSGLCDRL